MPALPYPLLSNILNLTRAKINDVIVDIGGQTLVNSAAFTPVYANAGFRRLQQKLVSLGYVRFKIPNFIIPNLPPVANADPALQVFINWVGYFDGVATSSDPTFSLPQNLIRPLKLSQRASSNDPSQVNLNEFIDIDMVDSLPNVPKLQWNQIAVWNFDAIWMPGALVSTDLQVTYAAYLPDFTTGTFPGDQTVDILRCENALAGYIAGEFSLARGDLDADAFFAEADKETMIIAGVKPAEEA